MFQGMASEPFRVSVFGGYEQLNAVRSEGPSWTEEGDRPGKPSAPGGEQALGHGSETVTAWVGLSWSMVVHDRRRGWARSFPQGGATCCVS